MNKFRFLKIILLVPFLKGCIYSPTEYYAPEGKGIYLQNSVCGNSGPKDIAVSDVKDVRIYVIARNRNESTVFSVKIEIPEGHSVQFLDQNASVSGVRYKMDGPSYFDFYAGKLVTASIPLVGSGARQNEVLSGHIKYHPIQYHYSITVPRSSNSVELSLPKIRVDDSDSYIEPISFLYKKGWYLTPLNC